jgi:phosphatidylinositol-3-phosphatase
MRGFAFAAWALAAASCKSSADLEPAPHPAPGLAASTGFGPATGATPAIRVSRRTDDDASARRRAIKTVFVVVMENMNWSDVYRASSAPFINSLLPRASYCTQYYDNPLGVHPSEPNYIWMESGFHQGLVTDFDPGPGNVTSANHLTRLMDAAGIAWKTYVEDAPAGLCPIESEHNYATKHVPQVFFTDVVGNPPSRTSPQCIRHVVPFSELAKDLETGNVPRYLFIVPNVCSDMHNGPGCPPASSLAQGDAWLARELPPILQSKAYADGGAVFLTWDESTRGENPIGMVVLSPAAKGGGYASTTRYFHSSLLRTIEEIFDLTPLLGDAATQPDLADLFQSFP